MLSEDIVFSGSKSEDEPSKFRSNQPHYLWRINSLNFEESPEKGFDSNFIQLHKYDNRIEKVSCLTSDLIL